MIHPPSVASKHAWIAQARGYEPLVVSLVMFEMG
jgi:hypothetical protein